MDARPRITVMLPTRGSGPILADVIHSVLDQPYADLELLVSDNANDDETPEVLNAFGHDTRLRVVRQPEPVSYVDNWNAALEASRGEYLLMLGDDDALLPGSLERLNGLLDEHSNPDVLSYDGYRFLPPGGMPGIDTGHYGELRFVFTPLPTSATELPADQRRQLVRGLYELPREMLGNVGLVLVRRPVLDRLSNGLYQAPFADYYALCALLLRAERWVHVPDHLFAGGSSENSFAHRFNHGEFEKAMSYLGIAGDVSDPIPGNPFVDAMLAWLAAVRRDYPEELRDAEVDRDQYVARQVWAIHRQRNRGLISTSEALGRLRLVPAADWWRLARGSLRKGNIRYVLRGVRHGDDHDADLVRSRMTPVPGVTRHSEFVRWLGEREGARRTRSSAGAE